MGRSGLFSVFGDPNYWRAKPTRFERVRYGQRKDLSAATDTRGADGISLVAEKKRGRRSNGKSVKK